MSTISVKTLYDPPKVGGDILSYCGKCKMELAHVIVSMVGSDAAKVICKTCNSQHNHKRKSARTTRATGSRPRATVSKVRAKDLWEERMAANNDKEVSSYNMKETFQKGTLVRHVKFGVGFVEEIRSNDKILILFEEGEKILLHAQGQK